MNLIKTDKLADELNQIDNKIFEKLNNKNIYELKRNNKYIDKKYHFYNSNCQIINKEIFDLLNGLDNNFVRQRKFKSIYCLFSNEKAIVFDENKTINVGIIDNDNIFVQEFIIYSNNQNESFQILTEIYNLIKENGFKFIEEYIVEDQIIYQDPNSQIEIKAKILYLNDKKTNEIVQNKPYEKKIIKSERNFSTIDINNELKELISLFTSQQKIERNYWRSKTMPEEVFLLNKKYIEQFDKKDTKDLYNKINSIFSQNYKNSNLNNIISQIDNSLLEKLDKEIKNKKSKIDINADCKFIKLSKKSIKIYDEFILINKELLSKFNDNIKNLFNNHCISYAKLINDDIIIINEKTQNTILIGNYNDKNYIFDIKFIIEYKEKKYFDSDIKYIFEDKKQDINLYIKENAIFNMNEEDLSPIFDDTDMIGMCYKYNKNITDYSSEIDYSEILNNTNLMSSISLSFNYQKINNNIGDLENIIEGDFYLIDFHNMMKLKEECYYEKIIEFIKNLDENILIDEINYKKNLIKATNSSNYKKLISSLNPENNGLNINNDYVNSFLNLNIVPVNYTDQNKENKEIMIYNNFELINKDTFNKLIENNSKNNTINYYKCIFTNGKLIVIINHPDKILGNKDPISLIGILNEKNIFIPEYILIYFSTYKMKPHLDKIKNNIIEFLQYFKFETNHQSQPIFDKSQKIGIIIKYNLNNNDNKPDTSIPVPEPIPPPIPPEKPSSIRLNFIEAPLIGLENIGATCYMNATLQCFSHIEKFINFFKYHSQPLSIYKSNPKSLTYSFKLLIDKLWPDNFDKNKTSKTYYAPHEFKTKISTMNPLFEGIAANDSKDLVNFIIMTLHEELNKGDNTVNNDDYTIDQRDKMKVFSSYMETFAKNNKSIISDLFYSTNCNVTECSNCRVKLYNYQVYFFIIFPLEEVRKFKYGQFNQNMNMHMNNNMNMNFINFMGNNNNNFMIMNNNFFLQNNPQTNIVDIFDCFNYDAKQNVMSGQNAMYCNYCRITCDSYMRTYLVTGPEILILLLNRGKGIQFDVKLNFTEYLDLSNYIEYKNTGYYYKLIGVITHIGESGMGGHFIAYCRDPLTEKWHKYNDAIVSEVLDFQNEVINFAMPYLLFYQKIK